MKIADLKAPNASRREAFGAFRSAIFTIFASFLLLDSLGQKKAIEFDTQLLKLSLNKCLGSLCTLIMDVGLFEKVREKNYIGH